MSRPTRLLLYVLHHHTNGIGGINKGQRVKRPSSILMRYRRFRPSEPILGSTSLHFRAERAKEQKKQNAFHDKKAWGSACPLVCGSI